MVKQPSSAAQRLAQENQELRARLNEAEQTLDAIRSGEVDALVVSGKGGERIFTLNGADQSYQMLVEAMQQGALIASSEGLILYANQSFADMLKAPLEQVIGSVLSEWVTPRSQTALSALLRKHGGARQTRELRLAGSDGKKVPVLVSSSQSLINDASEQICLVTTDLSEVNERKRKEAAALAQQLASAEQSIAEIKLVEASLRESEMRFRVMADTAPVLIWMSGEDKLCYWFNQVWLTFTGRTMTQEMGNGWAEGVHPDDMQHCLETYVGAFNARQEFSMEYRLRRFDGEYRWLIDSGVPRRNAQGSFLGYIGSCFDITERKDAEVALTRSEAKSRAFFDKNLAIMLMIRPDDGQIMDANHAAIAYYGYDQASFRRLHIYDLNTLSPEECTREMANASNEKRNFFNFRHRKFDGTIRDVEVYATPIRVEDSATLFTIVHDVTERNQIAVALSESEARYARVVDGTDEGLWEWDLVTQAITVNARFETMLGYTPGEWVRSKENWLSHVHLDDVEPSMRLFEKHLRGETPRYANLFRMKNKLGQWLWIQSKGKVASRDADGKAILIAGTLTDITVQRAAEDALKVMNNDFVKVLESSSDFMYFKDRDSRIRYCSQTLADVTGHTSWRDMVGKHDLEIFPPETAEIYHKEEAPVFADGIPLLNKLDPYFKADGSAGWVSTNKWPLFADDGKTVVGLFGISRDVTEAKRHEDELRVMATTDFLTGVETRRTFIGTIDYEIARMHRDSSYRCAILMFDLDHFKHVNDTYGHATGDEVLKHITKLMSSEIRKVDRIGRLGGEEFAILMPNADMPSAKTFAERLRQKVEASPAKVAGHSIVMTVSIGLSNLRSSDGTSGSALERVDQALYIAKNSGRNRVEVSL